MLVSFNFIPELLPNVANSSHVFKGMRRKEASSLRISVFGTPVVTGPPPSGPTVVPILIPSIFRRPLSISSPSSNSTTEDDPFYIN
ncbi:unnamed protein product [Orchesella dallaii]|uniref:Uncharacterized protein n=1 Tax=Orchesella dallaii TaxID=48710 RepID=A0ABP1RFY5_9HEXA